MEKAKWGGAWRGAGAVLVLACALAGCSGSDERSSITLSSASGQAAQPAAQTASASASADASANASASAWQGDGYDMGGGAKIKGGLLVVKGLVGSEKMPYLQDPRVASALARLGMRVEPEKAGSRDISKRDLAGYDFAFPSGAPSALEIAAKAGAKQTYNVFYTPMAIATWKALLPSLEKEGVAKRDAAEGVWSIDMRRLMALMDKGARWRDLKGSEAFPSSKSVLVSTTDVRTSNSAAMFLALASYVDNGGEVVDTDASIKKAAGDIAPLFARQGMQEASSAGPFEDYTVMGMGKAPLVMVYESQFIEYQAKRSVANPDMALAYPVPTAFSKSILVPLSDGGRRLGEALSQDPELKKIATEYGYRTADAGALEAFAKSKKIDTPKSFIDVVDLPSTKSLEAMIGAIEAKLQ